MSWGKCHNCKNKVPIGGQCNSCGFVHGLHRPPTDYEFIAARKINEKHNYEQFMNIDMLVLEHEQLLKK